MAKRRRGRPTKRESIAIHRKRRKAQIIASVIKDTGKINLTEARRRYSPNSTPQSQNHHSSEMLEDGVMDEVEKILKVTDKDILKKISPEVIVQDLISDLQVLNDLRDSGKIDTEEMVKVLNAKAGKQKLLGMVIGIWKAEKPQEREKSANELLMELDKLSRN